MQVVFRPYRDDPRLVAAEPDWSAMAGLPVDVDAARGRYEDILERWATAHGLSKRDLDRCLDVEDWTENAVKLLAALDTTLPVWRAGRGASHAEVDFQQVRADGAPFDPEARTVFVGNVLRWDPLVASRGRPANLVWPPLDHVSGGGRYWRDPDLAAAMRRRFRISTGNPDGPDGYVAVTRRLVDEGADRLLAKIVFKGKYQGPTAIDLPEAATGRPSTDPDAIWKAFFRAFEENLLDCEDRDECFLIQEERRLASEYRVVVVDGTPVAGAGTVEWLCPIWHDPAAGPFDPLVEGRRNGRELSSRPDLADLFRREAEGICAAHARRGETRYRDCTMDFAIDEGTGEPCLVEVNMLGRDMGDVREFGLYAMDYGLVFDRIVASRFAGEPSPALAP